MAKTKGSAGRTGTVKPNAPTGPVGDWDPKWEATDANLPAYLITPDGTILDNRKILSGENYQGSWSNSHSAAITAVAARNGWQDQGYRTLGSRDWGAGRNWEGFEREGGFVDVRIPDSNPASGFRRAQRALQTLVDKGVIGYRGRFTYAYGFGKPGTGYEGEGQYERARVGEFLTARNWRELTGGGGGGTEKMFGGE